MNRFSYEIYPESAADSSLYNSPTSGCRPGPHLIAIAGMMIAIQELDRLSLLADRLSPRQEPVPRSGTRPKTVVTPEGIPNTEGGISSPSPNMPTTPSVPPNSPTSFEDNATRPTTPPDQVGTFGREWRARSRPSAASMPGFPEEQCVFKSLPEFQMGAESCLAQTQSLPIKFLGSQYLGNARIPPR